MSEREHERMLGWERALLYARGQKSGASDRALAPTETAVGVSVESSRAREERVGERACRL